MDRSTSHHRTCSRVGPLAGCCLVMLLAPSAAVGRHVGAAPWATGLTATNDGAPFSGDGRLLTTISPNGDGLRDRATFRFSLDTPATAAFQVLQARTGAVVFSRTTRLPAGPGVLRWSPGAAAPGTFHVRLSLVAAGGRRVYHFRGVHGNPWTQAPVVRVLGIEAGFTGVSAAPGEVAPLEVSTDARSLVLQLFRCGPERAGSRGAMNGVAVTRPATVDWRAHRDRPGLLRVRVGHWTSGVYYARLTARDGGVGYAPLIVRPSRLGQHRVAVVMPTNTWQAYNFRDDDGDGVGNTWYAGWSRLPVRLGRPFLDRGEPPHFQRYDLPFLHWLSRTGRRVDTLSDSDLERVPNGAALAHAYDLIVFPGHHEYVTTHEYDAVTRYRDLGGNLAFLSANNFFWRVERRGQMLRRTARWRDLGRPEAALIGVQYLASDRGRRRAPFVVGHTAAAPWLFAGTGLVDGSRFTGLAAPAGRFGIEIDATAPSSPRGTRVLARIPDLYGPGKTAQMTYYETRAGAKVFAAGAFTLAGAATTQPVARMLNNLWRRLARP
jgi:hypothetical protein